MKEPDGAGKHMPDATEDHELMERALERAPFLSRPGHRDIHKTRFRGKPPRSGTRIHPKMRQFCVLLLQNGMNEEDAAEGAGYDRAYGVKLLHHPNVRAYLARRIEQGAAKVGLDLTVTRLSKELDWSIRVAKRAANRKSTVHGKCPKCQTDVPVLVVSDPKTIANLAMTVSKAAMFAARLTGSLAVGQSRPARGKGPVGYQIGGWGEVLSMVQEDPAAFTDAQKADLVRVAREEKIFIEEALRVLAHANH